MCYKFSQIMYIRVGNLWITVRQDYFCFILGFKWEEGCLLAYPLIFVVKLLL